MLSILFPDIFSFLCGSKLPKDLFLKIKRVVAN
jgi:hypothetical protein